MPQFAVTEYVAEIYSRITISIFLHNHILSEVNLA